MRTSLKDWESLGTRLQKLYIKIHHTQDYYYRHCIAYTNAAALYCIVGMMCTHTLLDTAESMLWYSCCVALYYIHYRNNGHTSLIFFCLVCWSLEKLDIKKQVFLSRLDSAMMMQIPMTKISVGRDRRV